MRTQKSPCPTRHGLVSVCQLVLLVQVLLAKRVPMLDSVLSCLNFYPAGAPDLVPGVSLNNVRL